MARRLIPLLLLALLGLIAPAQAAPIPGGTANSTPQGDKSAAVKGPAVPAPRWISDLEGYSVAEQALVLDGAGHLLVHALHRTPLEDRLIALDTADGTVAWETAGPTRECTPVASDDGRVFVQVDPSSTLAVPDANGFAVLALDADDGQPIDGAAYIPSGTDPFLAPCQHGLVLSEDDVLLVGQKVFGTAEPFVLDAFDVSGDTIDALWRIQRDAPGPENSFQMPPLSADGRSVWIGSRNAEEDLVVDRVSVADGTTEASLVVPGIEFGSGGDGTDNPFTVVAHGDDGLLVQTVNTNGSTNILRLDHSAGELTQTWINTVSDADPDIDGALASMAVNGDVLYAIAGPRQVVALDALDGSIVFGYDTGLQIRAAEPIAVDALGNTYLGTGNGGAILSVTPDGQVRVETPIPREFLGSEVTDALQLIGPIGPDGTLYVAGQGQDAPPQPVVAAIENGTFRVNQEGDVIDAAIQLCQYLFADGQARSVVLSRDDAFPDVLAGAPLAGDHSCILYTTGGSGTPIDPRTLAEVQRVLPAGGPVRIVGGEAAVASEVADVLTEEGFAVERIGGQSRHETALLIARIVAAENGTGEEVLLAFAGNWPDAVTGGAWAAKTGTPILLTDTATLSPEALTGLDELGTTMTTIAGGTAVVSQAAEDAVPGETRRVSGENRFATAIDVATSLWGEGEEPLTAEQAYVLANLEVDFGWALALAASPLSVRLCSPQVGIAGNGRYPDESREYLQGLGLDIPPGLFVLGDLNVIDDATVQLVETDIGRR